MNWYTSNQIFFRSSDARQLHSLQECTYTCSETLTTYHKRLLGKRHFELAQRAKREKESFRYKYFESPRKLQTLFNLCMDFVVFHLSIVDSFQGLPALIGEEIFKYALARNQFSIKENHYDSLRQNLLLFLEAYPKEILHSLDLSNHWKFLTFYLDELLILLNFLVNVRLSSCRIGDDHEILYGLGNLHQVKSIFLNNNELSDRGIKNLMEKRRRARVGLENLEVLDISCNRKLTSHCLLYFVSLPLLRCVTISLVDQKFVTKSFNKVCPKNLDHKRDFKIDFDTEHLASGWGQGLLLYWLNEFETSNRDKSERLERKKLHTNKMSFYKKEAINEQERKIVLPSSSPSHQNMTLCLCMRRSFTKCSTAKRKAEVSKTVGLASKKRCANSNFSTVTNWDQDHFNDIFNFYKS